VSDDRSSPYGCRRSWNWEPHGTTAKAAGTTWHDEHEARVRAWADRLAPELARRGLARGLPRCGGCSREAALARAAALRAGWQVAEGTWVCPACRPEESPTC
jgi:hypothetical protein